MVEFRHPHVVPPLSADGPIHVLVAGVPYSYSKPFPDGTWLTERHREAIQSVSPRINLMHMSRDELASGAEPAFPPEVILTETTGTASEWDDSEWLRFLVRGRDIQRLQGPKLRWLQSCSHGIEKVAPILAPHVTMVRAVDIHSAGLAESVLAAMLLHAKRLLERVENQRAHRWDMIEYGELHGKTAVVLGAGSLGNGFAKLARAFGMRVAGVRRNPEPHPLYDEMHGGGLEDLLPRADYLIAALPKTPETLDLVTAKQLALLPPHAFVANIGRGEVLNEADLAAALREGVIAGAYLDVFVQEPLGEDSELWDTPNLLITPHDAHFSASVGDRNVDLLCENLRHYLAGEPLRGVPDFEAGY
ncbi:D-2-hydroxyacid dehydrogenase [Amycolatopsis rubida]|uniref:Phosphoglycerate dehydrogenase n=1 Tax=Amycolatopsis rubida TaxID=112413 RepID=A0A1I5ZFU5_9PSEU|nr:D-2-hydroxyacid dehydrogenase [Amycolatopsis rubida]SFQ55344.1 Phosphoglycerate dehydrogenase [Amycolatopsis rubida]